MSTPQPPESKQYTETSSVDNNPVVASADAENYTPRVLQDDLPEVVKKLNDKKVVI